MSTCVPFTANGSEGIDLLPNGKITNHNGKY